MSDMLTRYNKGGTPTVDDAKLQASGGRGVNYFDTSNVYQRDFTTGAATPGADPIGNFTDSAKAHYDQEVTELASNHEANASNSDSHYVNKHLNAAGTIYQSTTEK